MSPNVWSNKALAAELKEAARLLEVLGEDAFRAKAYQNAARNLESYEGDAGILLAEDRLTEVRGIGASLARELARLKTASTLPILERLRERVPESVRELFRVSGLGGKKVGVLWRSGVTSLEELVEAGREGRLAELKGFGQKSAESILAAAEFALASQERMRLDMADVLAYHLVGMLEQALPEARIEAAGSLRRRLETVGDLNFVVSGASAEEIAAALEPAARFEFDEQAPTSLIARLEGRKLQFSLVPAAQQGAAILYATGNAAYRQKLLERATERSLELRGDGLYQNGEALATPEEADALELLGLPYLVPERRESAEAEPVAGLLEPSDIRGLVHNHSTWSDAVASLAEMVEAARERGYAYYGAGDHSRSSFYANGLSVERVYAQAEEIALLRNELQGGGFEILHGLEVDILPDGKLDYPDEVLETLDYTVVSVHQQFQLSESEQTRRIIRAVENPHAVILGHMTGRLLLRRPSYSLDIQAVLSACAAAGTVVEINASPYRLDLDWRWVMRGKELGCRFALNPDAHSVDGLDDIVYGVWMARKAGLTAADVVNTAPTGQAFLAQLKTARELG